MRAYTLAEIAALPLPAYRGVMKSIKSLRRGPGKKAKTPGLRGVKINKQDVWWSKQIRDRADRVCEVCRRVETKDRVQAHHIISRRYRKTRLDLNNGVALCARHHLWAHEHQQEFEAWVRRHIGDACYDRLWAMARGK